MDLSLAAFILAALILAAFIILAHFRRSSISLALITCHSAYLANEKGYLPPSRRMLMLMKYEINYEIKANLNLNVCLFLNLKLNSSGHMFYVLF